MTALEQSSPALDETAVDAFGDRMLTVLNDACATLMASIGHQTGLFDTLADFGEATSVEVAEAAGLDERYVREWLNAMTTARFVTYAPATRTYRLPPEHAAWLTRAAGPNNLAQAMCFVTLLAEVEQDIVQCFHQGGGLSYAKFPRFHALMAEDSATVVDASLVSSVVPLVPGLRRRLEGGIDVADIGCGRGHAINVLASAFPNSRFTGYDFSDEAIDAARVEAGALGVTNVEFQVVDVATLDLKDKFDLVTAFDAIHDQAHPATVLAAINRALRSDATFLMVDIRASSDVVNNLELPFATFLYTVSTMHCMTVSLGLGGDGLGTAWGEELATSMLHQAGFSQVDVTGIDTDPFNNYYICRT